MTMGSRQSVTGCADRNAVGANAVLIAHHPFDDGPEVIFGLGAAVTTQPIPGLTGVEVDDDQRPRSAAIP